MCHHVKPSTLRAPGRDTWDCDWSDLSCSPCNSSSRLSSESRLQSLYDVCVFSVRVNTEESKLKEP